MNSNSMSASAVLLPSSPRKRVKHEIRLTSAKTLMVCDDVNQDKHNMGTWIYLNKKSVYMHVLLSHKTATEQPYRKVIVWSLIELLLTGLPIGLHFFMLFFCYSCKATYK